MAKGKKCVRCKAIKPQQDFIDSDGKKFERCSECREAHRLAEEKRKSKTKCIKCHRRKSLDEFVRGGRQCRTCNACALKDAKDGRVITAKRNAKVCKRCGLLKEMEEFRTGGCYQRDCNECRTKLAAEAAAKRMGTRKKGEKGAVEIKYIKLYPGWDKLEFDGMNPFDPQVYPLGNMEMVA